MELPKFIQSLLPTIKLDTVTDDLNQTTEILRTVTIPAFKSAEAVLGRDKFKSDALNSQHASYANILNLGHGSMVANIATRLTNLDKALSKVPEMLNGEFTDIIIKDGITYRQAQIVQYVATASFVVRYATEWLNWAYMTETLAVQGEGEPDLPPAMITYVTENWVNFCCALGPLSEKVEHFAEVFADIPDAPAADHSLWEKFKAIHGNNKLDPMRAGLIGTTLNPIYHIRMAIVEWQAHSYHKALAEKKQLQMRRYNLERVMQGRPDANLQLQIERTSESIQRLSREIAEMEEKYA